MKKCVILALSILSLTLLFSLSYFNPASVSISISTSTSPSPSRAPHVLRRRRSPSRATRVPLSSPSLSFLFSHNQTLHPSLVVWAHMRDLLSRPDTLPAVSDGAREASIAFKSLLASLSLQKNSSFDSSLSDKNSCPSTVQGNSSRIDVPCGLVEDSAVTLVGVPIGKNGSSQFGIELIGSDLGTNKAVATERPIVLSWNVSLDPKQPVIYQNFWLPENGWGELDMCPGTRSISTNDGNKVDGLVRCNQQQTESLTTQEIVNGSEAISNEQSKRQVKRSHLTAGFPFVEGHPFTATLWNGVEGFHMTVNGRHETSYRYRERLEPWSVTEVRVLGDLDLLSVFVNGLPVSEDSDFIADLKLLRAPQFDYKKEIFLLVGVFSTANNFKRRMAIRRSWMQYEAVRSGEVRVRFFTGLHKNDNVNLELWREAELYGDIQIMPFVDYYSLITLKAVAICIFGTKIAGAKYIMKTDDDAFPRIDEIISILRKRDSKALLYGLISFQSSPHRDKDSKWFVSLEAHGCEEFCKAHILLKCNPYKRQGAKDNSTKISVPYLNGNCILHLTETKGVYINQLMQEWSNEMYPPWAHGPGYIISRDIAEFVVQGHEERYLQLFKLEDVAMGIWIQEYKNTGQEINYVTDDRFYNEGCESDYILAHYQSPRLLLCLWAKLQKDHRAFCCE